MDHVWNLHFGLWIPLKICGWDSQMFFLPNMARAWLCRHWTCLAQQLWRFEAETGGWISRWVLTLFHTLSARNTISCSEVWTDQSEASIEVRWPALTNQTTAAKLTTTSGVAAYVQVKPEKSFNTSLEDNKPLLYAPVCLNEKWTLSKKSQRHSSFCLMSQIKILRIQDTCDPVYDLDTL